MRHRLRYLGVFGVLGMVPTLLYVGKAQDETCVPAPSGMLAWWTGNGNANDLGVNNPGQAGEAVTYGPGRVGQGFVMGANHGGVKIPTSRAVDVGAYPGFTIEAWINPQSIAPGHPIFEWNNGTTFGVHMWIFEENGKIWTNFMDTAGGAHFLKSEAGVLVPNVFQHIALTYDKNTGMSRLYKDGAVVAEQNLGQFRPQTGYDLYLGTRPAGDGAGLRFLGIMDEVSLYRRALVPAEIQRIFKAGSAGKCTTPPGAATPRVAPGAAAPGVPATGGLPRGPIALTPPLTAPTLPPTGLAPNSTIAGPAIPPTPIPAPVIVEPLPTPTPMPMIARPVANGPVAVLDFTVAEGIDATIGHQASDALARELQKSGYDVRTRGQIETAMSSDATQGTPSGQRPPLRSTYKAAMQKRMAQSVGAGSMMVGNITMLEVRNGKSARVQMEVRQLETATGALMDGIYITETAMPKTQGAQVQNSALINETINKAVARAVRTLKQARS